MLEAWCGPIELYSSNSFGKACMVHIVLSVVIMWRGVDEPTPKISFLFSQKKKKNLYSWISFQRQGVPYMSAFISFTDYGITPQIIYVHDMTFHAKKKKRGSPSRLRFNFWWAIGGNVKY